MRLAFIVASCLALQGCFAMFHVPAGDPAASANTCVPEDHVVGRRLRNETNGKIGTIKELHGRHQRCQVRTHPILATVEYE